MSRKETPQPDVTRNTHNYFAQGGNELVIGGKLTFLPGAVIEGGEDLFGLPVPQIEHVPASEATTVAALRDDLNALLSALKAAGLMIDESASSGHGA